MSLNPLAPAFLPHFQSSPDPPISLCNSTAMSLPLAQLLCGMPSQILPSHAPSVNQHIADGTLLLPLLQPTNQSKPVTGTHQPAPGSSSLLSSPIQHQANCLQAIHKTLRQFNQHLKAEHLDRQTLQLIVLQLHSDFALLRSLLFANKDIAVKTSTTSPLLNPNTNPDPASSVCTEDPKLRSTLVGAVGPFRAKANKPECVNSQSSTNTLEAPPITTQKLNSRISRLENFFAAETATYTSMTAGIHSQYLS